MDALGAIKRDGDVKMAKCPSRPNGERYVYYPLGLPDPDDARRVESGTGDESDESDKNDLTLNTPWD